MVIENGVQILGQSLQGLIRIYVSYLTFGIGIAAGIIIGISSGIAFVAFLKILRKPTMDQTMEKETIRLRLARGILLALDFEVASDILKSILIPSAFIFCSISQHIFYIKMIIVLFFFFQYKICVFQELSCLFLVQLQ